MQSLNVRITFTEEALGTASANPEIHDEFIASKAPDALSRNEEVTRVIANEGLDEAIEKSMTVFPRTEDGQPFIWDYQMRGFFKDACSALRRVKGAKSSKLTAFKKVIDGTIFVKPRQIPITLSGDMGVCQRPLRASTAQGDRVALASSETVPAGSEFECEIICLEDSHVPYVEEWLNYGSLKGLLQWRNAGFGSFEWEEISDGEAR